MKVRGRTKKVRLTKRAVESITPPASGVQDVWDTEIPAYHIRVRPSGRRSYRFKYRYGGSQRIITIGEHGAFTAEQARTEALSHWNSVRKGGDPLGSREQQLAQAASTRRAALTVGELCEKWLVEGRRANPAKRESSWATDARKLRRHILPLLGDMPVRSLSKRDIELAQARIAGGETAVDERTKSRGRAIVKGGRGAARSSIMSLSACLSWAVGQEILESNPCVRVKKERARTRERFLSTREAAELFKVMEQMEERGRLSPIFGDIIRLLLLTGARKTEIQELSWSEVDLDGGLIRLSRERSKTGEKVVVLGNLAVELLRRRRRKSAFVFPSSLAPGRPTSGIQKAWERVRKEANLTDVRIHDLRHSFASFAAARGASLVVIGKALGHAQASSTHRYTHLTSDPVRAVADLVGTVVLQDRRQSARKR